MAIELKFSGVICGVDYGSGWSELVVNVKVEVVSGDVVSLVMSSLYHEFDHGLYVPNTLVA